MNILIKENNRPIEVIIGVTVEELPPPFNKETDDILNQLLIIFKEQIITLQIEELKELFKKIKITIYRFLKENEYKYENENPDIAIQFEWIKNIPKEDILKYEKGRVLH